LAYLIENKGSAHKPAHVVSSIFRKSEHKGNIASPDSLTRPLSDGLLLLV
jgi:hypothetical protein